MNIRNNFSLIGRLTQDPTVFDNADGSKKVRFTLAAKDNFAGKDGQYGSQFIPVEAFVSKENAAKNGVGVYASMHKGDLVGVTGQIQNNNYKDKDGVDHYDLVLHIETRDLMEPKSVTDARLGARAAEGAAAE
jgi:single-stranded DNA-binding protein